MGHFMYKMLNMEYMVGDKKYDSNQWYDIDILINWGD